MKEMEPRQLFGIKMLNYVILLLHAPALPVTVQKCQSNCLPLFLILYVSFNFIPYFIGIFVNGRNSRLLREVCLFTFLFFSLCFMQE